MISAEDVVFIDDKAAVVDAASMRQFRIFRVGEAAFFVTEMRPTLALVGAAGDAERSVFSAVSYLVDQCRDAFHQ